MGINFHDGYFKKYVLNIFYLISFVCKPISSILIGFFQPGLRATLPKENKLAGGPPLWEDSLGISDLVGPFPTKNIFYLVVVFFTSPMLHLLFTLIIFNC